MGKEGNTANDLIIHDEDEDSSSQLNTMHETIKQMGKLLFEDYPEKTSNLTIDNINGIIIARTLNDYKETNFGYRHTVLDTLITEKMNLVVSEKGFGIKSITEFLKSIQASFEQHQIPERLGGLFRR